MLDNELLQRFIQSGDTLWVYQGERHIFRSKKNRLAPLLDYIDAYIPRVKGVTVFDHVVGNAAALLLKIASCHKAYSPIASHAAVTTLGKYGIDYHITEIVPYIHRRDGEDMCPMEKLSIGKEPDIFYTEIRSITAENIG